LRIGKKKDQTFFRGKKPNMIPEATAFQMAGTLRSWVIGLLQPTRGKLATPENLSIMA
jgi:hypothetical protein